MCIHKIGLITFQMSVYMNNQGNKYFEFQGLLPCSCFSDIDFLKPKMDNNIFYLVSDYSADIRQWMKIQEKKIDVYKRQLPQLNRRRYLVNSRRKLCTKLLILVVRALSLLIFSG